MDSSISTIFSAIIATASTVAVAAATAVRNISSWKRKYVGSIKLNTFHFKDDIIKIYEKKKGKTFTDDMCTTLVVYIKNEYIQFFNPKDNFRLLEFEFDGLTYDQDTFGISEDGLTFFSRDQDYIIVSTICNKKKGMLPIDKDDTLGYFNTIKYSIFSCRNSPQISSPQHSKFCFNKSCEQFALIYNGYFNDYYGKVKQMTKNGKTQLTIHNTFTGSVKRLIEIDVFGIIQMKFSDDGIHIALITTTSTLMIYNTITGELVKSHVDETLKDVCAYIFSDNIRWSCDSNKICVVATHIDDGKITHSSIVCFSNIFGDKINTDKIVINEMENSMNIGNWDENCENICFYAGKCFYTFNFDTNTFSKKTLSDNLTDFIIQLQFVTSELMVVVRTVKETSTFKYKSSFFPDCPPDNEVRVVEETRKFKDKTYESSFLPDCPPDKEVPYVDIVKIN
jgi:hypothetical protein